MKKELGTLLVLIFAVSLLCSCGASRQAEESTSYTFKITQTTVVTETTATASEASSQTTALQTAESTAPVTESVSSSAASTTATTAVTASAAARTTTTTTVDAPKTTAAKTTEQKKDTCFLTIDCRNLLKNSDNLKKSKSQFVPKSGYILKKVSVEFKKGETAFDILKRGCKENVCTDSCKYCQKGGVQLEFSFTPAYQSYYIEGIHQLYEKDCGTLSGWMYNVNGKYPDVSSSVYEVKSGDVITFAYTASMGDDL